MIRVGIARIGSMALNYIDLFYNGKIKGGKITSLLSRNKGNMKAVTAMEHGIHVLIENQSAHYQSIEVENDVTIQMEFKNGAYLYS